MIFKELMRKYKQKKNEKLYNTTPYNLYVVCKWADYAVLPCKWIGKFDKCGNPLIVEWNDHNGCYETYDIKPYYKCSTGALQYFFYKKEAAYICANILKEEYNRLLEQKRKEYDLAVWN